MHTSELDHNVHMEGLSSPKTASILKNDDVLFKKLIENIDDDTLLLATSDHGLIESGHGGISPEERASFLFAYRKNGLMRSHPFMEKYFPYEITTSDLDNFDLTPTVSLLVNNAPPFNSIGDLLTEVLPLQEDSTHLDIAKYLLRMRKEILEQKIKLATELKEINKEHHELLESMVPLLTKTERLLSTAVKEEEEEAFIQDCVNVIKLIKRQITLFKEYTSSRATIYDLSSAKIVMISAILGLSAAIWQCGALFQREKSLFAFNFGFREVGLSILAGVGLSQIFSIKFSAGIFAAYSLVVFLIAFFEGFLKYNPIKAIVNIFIHLGYALGYNRAGIMMLSGFVAFRVVENNNCVMTEHPLHSLFFFKILLDYLLCTISLCLVGKSHLENLSRIGHFVRRIKYITIEMVLIYLLSLGDLTLIGNFKSSLNKMHSLIEEKAFLIGTVVPGCILFVLILYYMTRVYKFKPLSIGFFIFQYIASLSCIYFSQVNLFWGREIVPLLILASTIYGTWYNFKVNGQLLLTKYHQLVLISLSVLPIVLLVGGHFSAYNSLLQICLLVLAFKYEKKPTIYMMMNSLMITRLSFYAAGQRLTLNGICLNCGTLFYNDYHVMSWLVVMVKTIYPYIVGSFFYLIIVLRHFEIVKAKAISIDASTPDLVSAKSSPGRGKGRPEEMTQLEDIKQKGSAWVFAFFMAHNVLTMSDALGNSILFTVDSTNVMIYQASSTYLYQFQLFVWITCLKILFFALN